MIEFLHNAHFAFEVLTDAGAFETANGLDGEDFPCGQLASFVHSTEGSTTISLVCRLHIRSEQGIFENAVVFLDFGLSNSHDDPETNMRTRVGAIVTHPKCNMVVRRKLHRHSFGNSLAIDERAIGGAVNNPNVNLIDWARDKNNLFVNGGLKRIVP